MTDATTAKIAALLAKAESTDSSHEAEALTAKAFELMSRHGIEEAAARAIQRGEKQVKVHIVRKQVTLYGSTYDVAWRDLAAQVVFGLGDLRCYYFSTNPIKFVVVGEEPQVDRAILLINSLLAQSESALHRWWKSAPERRYLGRQSGWKARRQFLRSFAFTVGRRLAQIREATRVDVEREQGISTALVVQDVAAQIDDFLSDVTIKAAKTDRTEQSWCGQEEGRAAGNSARLDSTEISGNGGQIGR